MFRELMAVLRNRDPDEDIRHDISAMLDDAQWIVGAASDVLLSGEGSAHAVVERDKSINEAQQRIRQRIVGRLELSTATERARFLLYFSLIKDVERIGDYAKNLVRASEFIDRPWPDHPFLDELRAISQDVQATLRETPAVLQNDDQQRASQLVHHGHLNSKRCNALVAEIVHSDLSPRVAVPLALAARCYQRIQKHLMNVLSSVVMPLHKVDYYEPEQFQKE